MLTPGTLGLAVRWASRSSCSTRARSAPEDLERQRLLERGGASILEVAPGPIQHEQAAPVRHYVHARGGAEEEARLGWRPRTFIVLVAGRVGTRPDRREAQAPGPPGILLLGEPLLDPPESRVAVG